MRNWFQIDANDLQFEQVLKCIFSKFTSSSKIHQTTTFNLKYIFVHFHAQFLLKNWLCQHGSIKQICRSTQMTSGWEVSGVYVDEDLDPHEQYTIDNNLQPQIAGHLSNPVHTLWAKIGWVSIFLKKQIPNWRKWPQFESCQMYLLKGCSTSTVDTRYEPLRLNSYLSTPMHTLVSKYWPSQHNFKKQITIWRNWPQIESCHLRHMFKIYSSSTIYQTTTFKLKYIFAQRVCMHTLLAQIGWVGIFWGWQVPDWPKWPNCWWGAKCRFWKSTPHQQYTRHQPSTSNCIFVNLRAYPLSQNWLSQHIFKKQIANWR